MKIEDDRNNKEIEFKELELGDCFEHAGNLYLRTECTFDDISGEIEYNSVMLADGALTYFDEYDTIHKVNAKIVVE